MYARIHWRAKREKFYHSEKDLNDAAKRSKEVCMQKAKYNLLFDLSVFRTYKSLLTLKVREQRKLQNFPQFDM